MSAPELLHSRSENQSSAPLRPDPIPSFSSASLRRPSFSLRLIAFLIVFIAEWGPLTYYVHKGRGAGILLQIAIAAASLFVAIAYLRSKEAFRVLGGASGSMPIRWSLLGAHLVALGVFFGVSIAPSASGLLGYASAALWYAIGLTAIGLLVLVFIPWRAAVVFVRSAGYAWLYSLAAGLLAWRSIGELPYWNGAVLNPTIERLTKAMMDATFILVRQLLRLFVTDVVANQAKMIIGSPKFQVILLPWCAGFEGLALMLIFSTAWLAYFRREYRFPNALLLVPAGMLVIWLSNAVRITALILIGVAGFRDVAAGGFHSQAGWIAFNVVALSFAVLSRRMPWVTAASTEQRTESGANRNATAAYLLPFLAILAAAMIGRATSSGFEWLYPLRFAAAIAALWFFRSEYKSLDWRFGGFAVAAGCAVFGLWIGLDRLAAHHAASAIGAGLAKLPVGSRLGWILVRTVAAVITVPIAEELTFRGFLIRRVSSADFDQLSPRYYTLAGLAISSLAFGLMHGDRWIAGTLAGLIYAAAFLRRGRIGDAVAAHATTNALLAAYVLLTNRWDLW